MLLLSFTTLLFLFTFGGIGHLFRLSIRWTGHRNPFVSFFIGFALAGTWFMGCAFFTRLSTTTLIPLFALGTVGLALAARNHFRRRDRSPRRILLLSAAALAFLDLLMAWYFSATRHAPYDTYLYHASWVSWANAFPVVPGLANLHGRLGTNSLYLAVAAGIDVGLFDRRSAHILPCLFLVASTGFLLWEIAFSSSRTSRMACLCMLAWMLAYVPVGMNLYFDGPAMFFLFAAFLEMILLTEEPSPPATGVTVAVLFAATSFAIKQTVSLGMAAVFAWAVHAFWRSGRMNAGSVIIGLSAPVVLGVCHVIRNLIVSGYPAYPWPHLRVEFPWTVKQALVENVYEAAKYFRRLPGTDIATVRALALHDWVGPWFERWRSGKDWILFWAGLLSFVFWVRPLWQGNKKAWYLFVTFAATIVVWFFASPNLRYGGAFFFLLLAFALGFGMPGRLEFTASALLLCLMVLQVWMEGRVPLRLCLLLISPLVLAGILTVAGNRDWAPGLAAVGALCLVLVVHPLPLSNRNLCDVAPVRSRKVVERMLNNGQNPPLKVWTPVKGDQCGDAPLPCTPYPNDDLELIVPGDLSSGFRVP